MALSSKNKRLLQQCLPFVIIWSIFGALYVVIERGILDRTEFYPATSNAYSFVNNTLLVVSASILMGFVQGLLDVKFFKSKFQSSPLIIKLLFKSLIYLILTMTFFLGLPALIAAIIYEGSNESHNILQDMDNLFSSFAFWSVGIYCGVAITFAQLFSEIRTFSGPQIFYNFLFGKYFKPIEEVRIFMFLDMKGSTTLAETMGHTSYFELLRLYFSDMTNAIIDTKATIYQYVGDEIVLTWTSTEGLKNNNCVECFFKIESALKTKEAFYKEKFGHFPKFKAGLHMGSVTTGEIGVIKKDIIYTGDVLNTAARIQSQCNIYDSKFIVSKAVKSALSNTENLSFRHLGELALRGKQNQVDLFDLRRN